MSDNIYENNLCIKKTNSDSCNFKVSTSPSPLLKKRFVYNRFKLNINENNNSNNIERNESIINSSKSTICLKNSNNINNVNYKLNKKLSYTTNLNQLSNINYQCYNYNVKSHEKQLNINKLKKNRKSGPLSSLLFNNFLNIDKNISKNNEEIKQLKLNLYHSKLIVNSGLQAIISIISILLGILNIIGVNSNSVESAYLFNYSITSFMAISVFILSILIIMEYYTFSHIIFEINRHPSNIWRKRFSNIVILITYLLLVSISPNPYFIGIKLNYYIVSFDTSIHYYLNDILSIFLIPRVILILKFILYYSKYSGPKIDRIANMKGVSISLIFPFKCLMISNPYSIYPLIFLMFLLFSTFGIIIGESPLENITNSSLSKGWNALWCSIITILTVGYGDFYPRSLIGRIIIIISSLGGAFLLSMLISNLSNIFNFDEGQYTLCLLIQRIMLNKEKEKNSFKIVSSYLKVMDSIKKNKPDINKLKKNKYITNNDRLIYNGNVNKFNSIINKEKKKLIYKNYNLKKCLNKIKKSYFEELKDEYIIDQANKMEERLKELKIKFDKLSNKFTYFKDNNINKF